MINKNQPQSSQIKEVVARHLRSADTCAKEGRYEDALLEIQRALALDQNNYYARSFQDRIRAEIEKRKEKLAKKEQQEVFADEKKLDDVSQLLKTADQFIASKDYKEALKVVARVYKIDPHNYFASSYSDRIEILMTQEAEAKEGAAPQQATVQPKQPPASPTTPSRPSIPSAVDQQPFVPTKPPAPSPARSQPVPSPAGANKDERASLLMYRQMLKEMWFDGRITAEEDQELKKVRQMFSITQQEHEDAEKLMHIEAYVDALKTAWRDGVISPTESEVLQLMRQRFNITMEEHMSAETQILWARNNNALTKGTILIVEDDRTMLLSFAAALKKHGYDVLTAESIGKAIKILEQSAPLLILSDLMFGPGEKTGLEFYQHVRSNLKFREIPFLLMSGISDEFVVRAGRRMGVDDFLTKPFSLELLLATIEGKLRSLTALPPQAV
jgi:CheY-like chemotaxis protein